MENNPIHVTRRRQKNDVGHHCNPTISIERIRLIGDLKLVWCDPIHRSRNELYLLPTEYAVPTNVCIRNADDTSIVWRYDSKGPRQSARPYVNGCTGASAEYTRYVRVATQTKRKRNTYSTFLHPTIATALIEKKSYIPPGDVVGRWNHAKACNNTDEARRMHAILCDGLPICVYFE